MEYVTLKITSEIKDKIIKLYQDYQQENNGDYITFFANYEGTTITIYESKKGLKCVFSGEHALDEAKIFNQDAEVNTPKTHVKTNFVTLEEQIGSDEVGFGDFFGPLVVVGCYFNKDNLDILNSIDDSKKLTDKYILEFVPTILNKVLFSKLTVNNLKYNELISKGLNMNEIKSKLHNQVLLNLKKKQPQCNNFYIDQFTPEDIYYHYLSKEKEVVKNITFHTKGESYYPSVALASMIARYCFLKEMDVLNDRYNLIFPKGAGKNVDEFIQEFLKKYSKEELKKLAKLNFANFRNLD